MIISNMPHAIEPSKIIVGSKNTVKVSAVRETVANYKCLANAEVIGIAVSSGVSDQPLSLEETIQGAKNRAQAAYQAGTLCIGLEGGLMKIPTSNDEYMHISICSIFDGQQHHLGMSSGFRIPKVVSSLIVGEGLDLNQAMKKCGFTDNPQLGASEGTVGLFTNGRIPRKAYCKQSLTTALISIEQPKYFKEAASLSEMKTSITKNDQPLKESSLVSLPLK